MADARPQIRLVGFDQLADGSADLFDAIGQAAVDEFDRIAGEQASVVAGRVPRVSGALAGSVTSYKERDGAVVGMGEGLPYAGWIEFGGTRGRPYLPGGRYLFPVGQQAEPQIVAAANHAAETEIKGAIWKPPK